MSLRNNIRSAESMVNRIQDYELKRIIQSLCAALKDVANELDDLESRIDDVEAQ